MGCRLNLGADWQNGSLAGLFACNLNNVPTTAGIHVGCRLASRFSGYRPNLGAQWNDGSLAGLFACNLNNPYTNANVNIGCRLATRNAPEIMPLRRHGPCATWGLHSAPETRRNTKTVGAASSLLASVAPASFFSFTWPLLTQMGAKPHFPGLFATSSLRSRPQRLK